MSFSSPEGAAFGLVLYFFIISLSYFPSIQYILHFVLALQRFLLYFYPEYEKYFAWSKLRFNVLLISLYSFFTVKNSIVFCIWQFAERKDIDAVILEIHWYLAIFLNSLLIISAILYIPIMISVLKLTNLVSAAEHKPHIYIFCQVLLHLSTRIIFFTILITDMTNDERFKVFGPLFLTTIIDIFMTPLTIQVAYLICSRKNVRTVLNLSLDNIFRDLCCSTSRTATVQPGLESTRI